MHHQKKGKLTRPPRAAVVAGRSPARYKIRKSLVLQGINGGALPAVAESASQWISRSNRATRQLINRAAISSGAYAEQQAALMRALQEKSAKCNPASKERRLFVLS